MEAKNYLQEQGFHIESKQEKFQLVISSDGVVSTDERFTMDNLGLGDSYKPLDAYFRKVNYQNVSNTLEQTEASKKCSSSKLQIAVHHHN